MSKKRYQTTFDNRNSPSNPELYGHIQRLQNLLEQYDRQNLFLNKQVLDILKNKQTFNSKFQSSKFNNKNNEYKLKKFIQPYELRNGDKSINRKLDQVRKQNQQRQKIQRQIERLKVRKDSSENRKANSVKKYQYYDDNQDQFNYKNNNNRRNNFYTSSSRKFNYVSQQQQKSRLINNSTKAPSKTYSSFYTKPFTLSEEKQEKSSIQISSNKFYSINTDFKHSKEPQNKNNGSNRSISKSKYILQKINQSQEQQKSKFNQPKRIKSELQTSSNIVPVIKRQVYFKSPDQSNTQSPQKRNQSPIDKNYYENISRISIKSDQSKKSGIQVTTKKSPQKKQSNKQLESPKKIQKQIIKKTQIVSQQQPPEIKNIQSQKQINKMSESIIKHQIKQQIKKPSPQPQQPLQRHQSLILSNPHVPIQQATFRLISTQISNPVQQQVQPVGFQTIRTKYLTSIGINTQSEQPFQLPQPQMTRNKSFSHHKINPSQKIIMNKPVQQQIETKIERTKSVDKKKKFINVISSDLLSNKLGKIKNNEQDK